MTENGEPTFASGKICYLEIPAADPQASAAFYHAVFDWPVRAHDDGSLAFDDTVGGVSGTWVRGRVPLAEAGIMVSIMVSDADDACARIVTAGGTIVRPVDPNASAGEITAWFRDPGGNLLAIYEHRTGS